MARSICIICPECIKNNQKREYQQELEQTNTEDIVDQEDIEQISTKPKTVVQLSGWIEYAYHILDNHPDSERVEWAKSSLEKAGKLPTKQLPKVKSEKATIKKSVEESIKLIPKNEDGKYANDLKELTQNLDEELKPYISKGNEPIKISKPTLLSRLAKKVGSLKSLKITTK